MLENLITIAMFVIALIVILLTLFLVIWVGRLIVLFTLAWILDRMDKSGGERWRK